MMVPTWRTLLKDKSSCCNCSLAQNVGHFYGVCPPPPKNAFLIGKTRWMDGVRCILDRAIWEMGKLVDSWTWRWGSWLKLTPNGGLKGKIIYKWWIFHGPLETCGDLKPKKLGGINRNRVASRCITLHLSIVQDLNPIMVLSFYPQWSNRRFHTWFQVCNERRVFFESPVTLPTWCFQQEIGPASLPTQPSSSMINNPNMEYIPNPRIHHISSSYNE